MSWVLLVLGLVGISLLLAVVVSWENVPPFVSGSGGSGGSKGSASTGCVPVTCQSLGATCGPAGDGCGSTLQCGSCPDGQICGGGGGANPGGSSDCPRKNPP